MPVRHGRQTAHIILIKVLFEYIFILIKVLFDYTFIKIMRWVVVFVGVAMVPRSGLFQIILPPLLGCQWVVLETFARLVNQLL